MNAVTMPRGRLLAVALSLALGATGAVQAAEAEAESSTGTRSGREIFERFRAGLAEPTCPADGNRWAKQYAPAPAKLANADGETLEIFGHVVDSLQAAHLPTEYALIPFVESGYRPSARSPAGPAGMWQFIASTARAHKVPMSKGYDGRMSPIESTKAAVRYLKTLHGMFGGNWRLAAMAYNVGEGRVLGAIKRSGQTVATARPESLGGLPQITRVYDDKVHAISCILVQAGDRQQWLASLDRPVRQLGPVTSSAAMIAAVEPAPKMPATAAPEPVASAATAAAPAMPAAAPAAAEPTAQPVVAATANAIVAAATAPRRHVVARGETLWRIAKRYGVSVSQLLRINGMEPGRLLAPGMELAIDAVLPGSRK